MSNEQFFDQWITDLDQEPAWRAALIRAGSVAPGAIRSVADIETDIRMARGRHSAARAETAAREIAALLDERERALFGSPTGKDGLQVEPDAIADFVPTDGWWCPHCVCVVPNEHVTFQETHDMRHGGCGYSVSDTIPDPHVEAVRAKLLKRSETGIATYRKNLTRTDLSTPDWLQHLQDELMDGANYVQRLLSDYAKIKADLASLEALRGAVRAVADRVEAETFCNCCTTGDIAETFAQQLAVELRTLPGIGGKGGV